MIYLITIVPIVAIIVIAFAVARMMRLEKAAIPVFIICAFFGNTGYIGFPLNIASQGRESLALTAFVSTIYTVIVFTFGAWLCQRYSSKEKKDCGCILSRSSGLQPQASFYRLSHSRISSGCRWYS